MILTALVELQSTIEKISSDDLKPIVANWFAELRKDNTRISYGRDVCTCSICENLLCDPVTVACGHTFCCCCVVQNEPWVCRICGKAHELSQDSLRVNVLIASLMSKWWPEAKELQKMKCEARKLFKDRMTRQAVEVYTAALKIDPCDHMLTIGRSKALLALGKVNESLMDAELTIQLKPHWPYGYFQRGAAMVRLGKYEDAIVAYLQCLILDADNAAVNEALVEVLKKLLNQSPKPNKVRCHSDAGVNYSTSQRFNTAKCSSDDELHRSDGEDTDGMLCKKVKRSGVVRSASTFCSRRLPKVARSPSREHLRILLERCSKEVDKMKKMKHHPRGRVIDENLIDKGDFECTLCYRLLWEAVTTPCGHVFCRMCIDRSLDYTASCPLCKASLEEFLAQRQHTPTEFIDLILKSYVAKDYLERKRLYEEEMQTLAKAGKDTSHEIPIFVCTLSYPTVPCPLHVFEPRYRHMIRQCMESGSKRFGMCTRIEGVENSYADCGTMLEIQDVKYFPDGRSVVDTIGGKRFRIIRKGQRDGYNTATVEFLLDEAIEDSRIPDVKKLHDEVHQKVVQWFNRLNDGVKSEILQHFGAMPAVENDYIYLPNGPSWHWWTLAILPLDPRAQLSILQMNSFDERLHALHRFMQFMGARPL